MYDVHFANLNILKTEISLERKEIFEKSRGHFFFSYRLLVPALKQLRKERCEFDHSSTLRYQFWENSMAVGQTFNEISHSATNTRFVVRIH